MIRNRDRTKSTSRFKPPPAARGGGGPHRSNATAAAGGDGAERVLPPPPPRPTVGATAATFAAPHDVVSNSSGGGGVADLKPWRDPQEAKDELLLASFRASLYVDGLLLRLRQCSPLRQEDEVRPLSWIKQLIRSDAFNQPIGEHALLNAAAIGSATEVAQLLAGGANANTSNSRGWTALHYACAGGHTAAMALLLRAGAIVERRASLAKVTPLALAVYYARTACVQTLLQARANPSARVGPNNHALLVLAVAKGHPQCIVPLIRAGAEVDAKEEDGSTAMHVAAAEGRVDCIKVLASEWSDIEAKTNAGWTPLHVAARCGHAPALSALLGLGVEINAATKDDGRTALQCCSLSEKDGCFEALLAAGADIAHRDRFGVTLLHEAAGRGCVDVLKAALNAGVTSVESRSVAGWTPLFAAVVADRLRSAELLLKHGAANCLDVPDRAGLTPLHVAVMHKDEELIRLLLSHGASAAVAAKADTGHTPLHLAATMLPGGLVATQLLLRAKAPLDAVTRDGETPLHLAALTGNVEVARCLLAAGASTALRDKRGRRAVDCATGDAVRQALLLAPQQHQHQRQQRRMDGEEESGARAKGKGQMRRRGDGGGGPQQGDQETGEIA